MDIEVIKHIYSEDRPYCILGVMNNEQGVMIRNRMMLWLDKCYNVIEILHDGTQFEYPALHYLQEWCIENNKPALYLHTRGAFNNYWTTPKTHKLWEVEFRYNKNRYFGLVDNKQPTCACPFTSQDKHTFYNGFVVNAEAMRILPTIQPNSDRFVFEDIFKDSKVNVIGTKTVNNIQEARAYLTTI